MQSFTNMKTLLVRGQGTVPPQVREIVRRGSTEVKEVRADEERDASTLEPTACCVERGERRCGQRTATKA